MTDKFEIISRIESDIKRKLEYVDWPIEYGTVEVQVRAGRTTLIGVKFTIKAD